MAENKPPYVRVNDVKEDAQVTGPPQEEPDTAEAREVHVQLDEPVLDTSSPDAVIVPPEGRGSLELPIHALANPTVEEEFAKAADEPERPEATEEVDQARQEGTAAGGDGVKEADRSENPVTPDPPEVPKRKKS